LKLSLSLALILLVGLSAAAKTNESQSQIEKKINEVVAKMTLEEKIDFIGEYYGFNIHPMEKYGIPEVVMSDGPLGVRNYGRSTQYTAGVTAASSWNRGLIYKVGEATSNDCKARGVNLILGPGVNINRAPMCGRNFEYFSEDPYLSGEMAVSSIKGLQDHGIAACVKHYALNNMEWGRGYIDSRADERTMQEIYLPAFRAAVVKGKVASIMDSYNLINGHHATESKYLNIDVLRNMWNFDGIVMSDWGATHDAVAAANGGLDLDMDGNVTANYFNRKLLLPAVKEGKVSEATINEKVRHILTVIYRFGWDKKQVLDPSIPLDNPASAQVAYQEACEGIVLLKNAGNILPLSKNVGKIAIVGPLSNVNVFGGGSSQIAPFHFSTAYSGLKEIFPNANIQLVEQHSMGIKNQFYLTENGNEEGLNVELFNNKTLEGTPEVKATTKTVDFKLGGNSPAPGKINSDNFSARLTGFARIEKPGYYTFTATADDGCRVWVDGKLIIDEWKDQANATFTGAIELNEKKDYSIRIEYYDNTGEATLKLAYDCNSYEQQLEAAKNSDATIVCVGYGNEAESEGHDRTFTLPVTQDELIEKTAEANPNTIVVIYSGGSVDMSKWIDKVKGVVFAGYPGQEGGKALAQIIAGDINPSGKLTATWGKRLEDCSAYDNFYTKGKEQYINYPEKLLVGYRYYDKKNIEPYFPFGFGLSYTTFEYSNIKVKKTGNEYNVSVTIKNTGKVAGAETAEVYVMPTKVAAEDPVSTLRGFDKVQLAPGESKTVTMTLDEHAFSTFKVAKKCFTVNKGTYTIGVGASSRDIRLKTNVKI
jgi:beta-glucosidase